MVQGRRSQFVGGEGILSDGAEESQLVVKDADPTPHLGVFVKEFGIAGKQKG